MPPDADWLIGSLLARKCQNSQIITNPYTSTDGFTDGLWVIVYEPWFTDPWFRKHSLRTMVYRSRRQPTDDRSIQSPWSLSLRRFASGDAKAKAEEMSSENLNVISPGNHGGFDIFVIIYDYIWIRTIFGYIMYEYVWYIWQISHWCCEFRLGILSVLQLTPSEVSTLIWQGKRPVLQGCQLQHAGRFLQALVTLVLKFSHESVENWCIICMYWQ